MDSENLSSIEVLETSDLFLQRESGRSHTPFETEQMFYACIQNGNVRETQQLMTQLLQNTVVTGKLSGDPLRQMQYWAVCCITLATRAAIRGGLDETTAFNLSDDSIQKIDRMHNRQEILRFLQSLCLSLTTLVQESQSRRDVPPAVRTCLRFIHTHLHSKLSSAVLSEVCALSPDYLCLLFKRTMGVSICDYVRSQRLQAARTMLLSDRSTSEIAYDLGFCSESYFIKCFKAAFGVTPREMRRDPTATD